ncbi:MAG: hypothetical protein ACK5TO_14030, partial [Planctomycetaceae bacterium]
MTWAREFLRDWGQSRPMVTLLLSFGWLAAIGSGHAQGQVGSVLRTGKLLSRGGEWLTGRLEELTAERLTWQGESATAVSLADVVRLEFAERQARLNRESPLVILANGDLLAAEVVQADEEDLSLRW